MTAENGQPAQFDETGRQAAVLAAAAQLVEAFGAHDVPRYFDCFAEDATFLLHDSDDLIGSRADYLSTWQAWEQDGFRVLGCRSLQPRVQLVTADTAVFTHRVRTTLAGAEEAASERETIVFRRDLAGRWQAVHEHLSIDPRGNGHLNA
jgi:ketosteroid isomerase-like protein